MLYGSIRRNLYAHLAIHKMRWTPFFDYLFTPISTPKWHETIWFCMKFYKLAISKNLVTMRFYGLLLRYIDLWKKANLQRYLISFLSFPIQKSSSDKDFCLSLFSFTELHLFSAVRCSSVNMHSYILVYHICAGLPIDTLRSFFFFSSFCDFLLFSLIDTFLLLFPLKWPSLHLK